MGLVPLEKAPQTFPLILRPCEDTAKSWSSMTWEAGTYPDTKSKNYLGLSLWNCEKYFSFFINHPVYVILLQQPEQIKTMAKFWTCYNQSRGQCMQNTKTKSHSVLYAADSDDEIRTVSVSRSAPLWGRSINPDMLQRAGMVWFNLLNSSLQELFLSEMKQNLQPKENIAGCNFYKSIFSPVVQGHLIILSTIRMEMGPELPISCYNFPGHLSAP